MIAVTGASGVAFAASTLMSEEKINFGIGNHTAGIRGIRQIGTDGVILQAPTAAVTADGITGGITGTTTAGTTSAGNTGREIVGTTGGETIRALTTIDTVTTPETALPAIM